MKFNKHLTAFIAFSLAMPTPLFSQAAQGTSILEFVQTHQKPKSLFSMRGRLLNASRAGITSLDGIEKIADMSKVRSLTVTGNTIDTVKANTFNYPQFNNLNVLDLSHCGLKTIEQGAFNGLARLHFLWLNGNQLTSLADGALSELRKNKQLFVFIANNPGGKALATQVQQQLPQAHVYTTNITQTALRNAAIVLGIALVVISVALGVLALQRQEKPYILRIQEEGLQGTFIAPTKAMAEEMAQDYRESRPDYWQQQLVRGVESQNLAQVQQALEQTKQAINIDARGLLVKAIETGNHDIILSLLRRGANPNVASYSETPLIAAVKKNDAFITQELLAMGADPNQRVFQDSYTPLIHAIKGGHKQIFDVLINFRANVNQRGLATPLMQAARKGDEYMVKKLLAKKADVNAWILLGGQKAYARDFATTPSIISLIENAPGYIRPLRYQQAYEAEQEYQQALSQQIITLNSNVAKALNVPDNATPWQILGVQPGATEKDISVAYKKLALKWHPDKYKEGQKLLAEEVMKAINSAKDRLLPPPEQALQQ